MVKKVIPHKQKWLKKRTTHFSVLYDGVMTELLLKKFPNKPSAFESEIHPSHKTPFCTLCISPLQGAAPTGA